MLRPVRWDDMAGVAPSGWPEAPWCRCLVRGGLRNTPGQSNELVAALNEVGSDYARHSIAAGKIAQEYFAAERVLGEVLRLIGLR